jgi:hypothetical protein
MGEGIKIIRNLPLWQEGIKMDSDYQDAIDAFKRDDYETSFKILLPLAEQGDPEAQLFLGELYYLGKGVEQDYDEAAGWYRIAAEQGIANAQCNVGQMLLEGVGVEQDYEEAVKWLKLAADQGHANAKQTLQVIREHNEQAGRGSTAELTEEDQMEDLEEEFQEYANATTQKRTLLSKHGHVILTCLLGYGGVKALELLLPSAFQGIRSQLAEFVNYGWQHPVAFVSLAVLCVVGAVILGALRHVWGDMLASALPMPVVDEAGRDKTVYLGDVPRDIWFSRSFRITTWLLVAILSIVFSIFLVSLVSTYDPINSMVPWIISISSVMYLRWLISTLISAKLWRPGNGNVRLRK